MRSPVLTGLMQDFSLTMPRIIEYAARWHGETSVVSRTCEGTTCILSYGQILQRVKLLAFGLRKLGSSEGRIIATLAWTNHRHLEAWYSIMGLGCCCHTLNPRFSDQDLTWIINDARDEILLSDITFVPQLERILDQCPTLKFVILMTDKQHMPAMKTGSAKVICYEDLLDGQVDSLRTEGFQWPDIDEESAAGLCYTSGTTGNPKGVLYSHRSNYLHSLVVIQKDCLNLGANDVCCPIVPMFHANCWGLVFAAPLVGAGLVLPGQHLDGPSVYDLFENFKVTVTAGVPTVWLQLLAFMDSKQIKLSTVKLIAIGGSAAPRSMINSFEGHHKINVCHLWGMTETSPIGTIGSSVKVAFARNLDEVLSVKAKQGRPHALMDLRIVNDEGKVLPNDGSSVGHIQCKGPCVLARYYNKDTPAVDASGFFSTGDVGTIDRSGVMSITDRSKDLVKSGGEVRFRVQGLGPKP